MTIESADRGLGLNPHLGDLLILSAKDIHWSDVTYALLVWRAATNTVIDCIQFPFGDMTIV